MNSKRCIKHNMAIKFSCILVLTFLSWNLAYSQDCHSTVTNSFAYYRQGEFGRVVRTLDTTLKKCNLSENDEIAANIFLTSAYYKLDEIERGDSLIKRFLLQNPHYTPDENIDPPTFIEALERFKVKPELSVGIQTGGNKMYPNVDKKYAIWDTADYSGNYKSHFNNSTLLYFRWHFGDYFSISLGGEYFQQQYARTIYAYNKKLSLEFTENITGINIPFFVGFAGPALKKFKPEVFFGANYTYLTETKANLNYKNVISGTGDEIITESKSKSNVNISGSRNMKNIGGMVGGRIYYKTTFLSPYIEVKYTMDSFYHVKDNTRFNNENLAKDYFYASDDFVRNTLTVSVGVTYTFSYKVHFKYK